MIKIKIYLLILDIIKNLKADGENGSGSRCNGKYGERFVYKCTNRNYWVKDVKLENNPTDLYHQSKKISTPKGGRRQRKFTFATSTRQAP